MDIAMRNWVFVIEFLVIFVAIAGLVVFVIALLAKLAEGKGLRPIFVAAGGSVLLIVQIYRYLQVHALAYAVLYAGVLVVFVIAVVANSAKDKGAGTSGKQ